MSNQKPTPTASRRALLKAGLGAAAVTTFLSPLRHVLADEAPSATLPGRGQAKQVMFLYMSGGASHYETLDPKPGNSAGGPTKAISTAVPGIQIASSLPGLAKRMKDIAILRGMSTKEGNHERARYLMHTGYAPNPTLTHASFGSIVSAEIGNPELALPNYVAINGPGAKAGYMGVNHEPFSITVRAGGETAQRGGGNARRRNNLRRRSGAAVQNLEAPGGMSTKRRDRRLELLGELNERFASDRGQQVAEAQGAMFERARRMMDSPKNTAFDLSKEAAKTRDAYGQNSFGQAVLMGRRLLDEDVSFVEVNMNGWDTHDDNFNRIKALNAQVDQAVSTLIDELKASGRFEQTLIVWVGDFGRTPRITATDGRGHYPQAWSTFMAGAGIQGGRVIGKTSEDGAKVVEGAVTPPQFFGSIAHATGVKGETTLEVNGRPISYVDEGGAPVADLFKA